MRDIKFRGKSEDGWAYGSYVDHFIVNEVVEATDEYIAIGDWCPVDVDTVSQFTGLKDKNNKEIYEGDIVRLDRSFDQDAVIKWADESAMFEIKSIYRGMVDDFDWYGGSDMEVIGNIFENPELLEVE